MVSTEPVRLVVPAGDAYQPALVEGATRLALRRGVSRERSVAFGRLISLAVTALNRSAPKSIEMRIGDHGDVLSVSLAAIEATAAIDADAVREFTQRAEDDAIAPAHETATPALEFRFAIG